MKRIALTWMAQGKYIPPDEIESRRMLMEALASAQTDLVLVDLRLIQAGTAGVYKVEADIDLTSAPETLDLDRIGQWIMERFEHGSRLLILRERT